MVMRASAMDDVERFICGHLTCDDIVLDIGANQGLYALLFSERARQVYCLEPNPSVFAILSQNVRAENVRLLPLAASDRCGSIDFYLDQRPDVGGVASSVNVLDDLHAGNMVEKVTVEAITVDHLCETHNIVPTFIKADVEGHEPALFRGAQQTIKRYQPLLVFEFWETWWDRGFSTLFTDLERYYRLVRLEDGADASHFYRNNRGQKSVDIAALPKRSLRQALRRLRTTASVPRGPRFRMAHRVLGRTR